MAPIEKHFSLAIRLLNDFRNIISILVFNAFFLHVRIFAINFFLLSKGYRQLVALLSSSEVADANTAGIFGDTGLRVDLIGSGPDESDIENTWREHAEDTTKGSTAAVARPLVSFRQLQTMPHKPCKSITCL